MLTEGNQSNPNNNSHENLPPIVVSESKSDTKESSLFTKEKYVFIIKALRMWRESTTTDKTQIVLILCNIATIIAFIWVGSCQHVDTLKSVALADSSYMLSKKSLDVAEHNFQIENRPYIGIKNITLDTFALGKKICITVTFQNYGKIPALEVRGISGIEPHSIPTYNIPEERFQFDEKANESVITSVVPPFEPRYHIIRSDSLWDRSHIEPVVNQRLYLYVYGRFIYTDVFNGRDTTTFCHVYHVDTKSFGSATSGNSMR